MFMIIYMANRGGISKPAQDVCCVDVKLPVHTDIDRCCL